MNDASTYIPFHNPSIGEEEIREVEATLRSGWLTTGPRTAQFEREFREYAEANHALALSSATAGLHLALAALDVGPGDEVITTPLTFCSTVQSILHVGAEPVLADVRPDGNIDPESIEERITAKTRAILPVHLGGLPCDMDAIWTLARQHGLFVIEDAAHAAGARYRSNPIGASTDPGSDAVVFSFYATKNLTTGEGGMVTTPHDGLAAVMRIMALHGMSKDAWGRYTKEGNWFYNVVSEGYKYNLSDIHSAVGIHQLRKLDGFIATRTALANIYNEAFGDLDQVEIPPDSPDGVHAWHLYILRLRLDQLNIDRAEFIERLRLKGIGCSVHFIPIPLHSYFAALPLASYPCPGAMELYDRIVSLPLYPGMTEEQVQYVARSVREILRGSAKCRARSPFVELPMAS